MSWLLETLSLLPSRLLVTSAPILGFNPVYFLGVKTVHGAKSIHVLLDGFWISYPDDEDLLDPGRVKMYFPVFSSAFFFYS